MIHFQDYEEYRFFRNKMKEDQKKQEATGAVPEERARNRTELVMEDNTIYEIDTECEECFGDGKPKKKPGSSKPPGFFLYEWKMLP